MQAKAVATKAVAAVVEEVRLPNRAMAEIGQVKRASRLAATVAMDPRESKVPSKKRGTVMPFLTYVSDLVFMICN